jgi:hypothetical protein
VSWREPITREGTTKFGELRDRDVDKTIVSSYTDADGEAEVRVSHDPSTVERARHWIGVPF